MPGRVDKDINSVLLVQKLFEREIEVQGEVASLRSYRWHPPCP